MVIQVLCLSQARWHQVLDPLTGHAVQEEVALSLLQGQGGGLEAGHAAQDEVALSLYWGRVGALEGKSH